MCGFIGVYGPLATCLGSGFDNALERLAHRGPDAQGRYRSSNGYCMLGHVRLSIVDTSEDANQPMRSGRHTLVYNGEIYNHVKFRQPGIRYRTHSDTETLLVALGEQGAACLPGMTGMYAGAFYDESQNTLLLFRDSLAIKPLYIMQLPDSTIVFASEIKAILALLPDMECHVDASNLESYMHYENYPQGCSLFEGIQLLNPGTCLQLTMSASGRVMQLETTIPLPGTEEPLPKSEQALVAELTTRIRASVGLHLMSDVPLGVYLSGGIDSSLVATMAAAEKDNLLGFTGYFNEVGKSSDYYDERPLARLVAKNAGIDLHEVPISPADFIENFDSMIYALDEPRMGMGAFSQYIVARQAARHRKVILAGHGGDELFGGYPLFKAFWLFSEGLSPAGLSALMSFRGKELPWLVNLMMGYARNGTLAFAPTLYPSRSPLLPDAPHEVFFTENMIDPLEALGRYYIETYLPGLLSVEDRISMAHGLETRVPLWSQPLIAYVSQIPIHVKLKDGQLKALLKEVARPYLPSALLSAPKRGFPTPLRLWFRESLFGFVKERLLADGPIHELVSPKKISGLLKAHRSQPLSFALDERRAHRIWILLCLESWMRQYQVTFGNLPPKAGVASDKVYTHV